MYVYTTKKKNNIFIAIIAFDAMFVQNLNKKYVHRH